MSTISRLPCVLLEDNDLDLHSNDFAQEHIKGDAFRQRYLKHIHESCCSNIEAYNYISELLLSRLDSAALSPILR